MVSSKQNQKIYKLVLGAMFLATALILPFFTGQVPQIGGMLCPMHIPVILCGFFCGPVYGLGVGFIAPLLRFALFGMPPVMPTGIAMSFELAIYGLVAGVLYLMLPEKKICVYISLIAAMIAGRLVWGGVSAVLYGMAGNEFGVGVFLAGAVINAIPGIVIQLILIPILVMAFGKFTVKNRY